MQDNSLKSPVNQVPAADRGVAVAVENVTKTFGTATSAVTAVDNVSLSIDAGSAVALTGPSGSGKSTLLHLLGAIERPDRGTITVADTDITTVSRSDLSTYRRSIGFVFQRFHLLPALTARDNVIAPLIPDRKRRKAGQARAGELLKAVGLEGREHHLPSQLSGGQQQRVAIARALIGRPGLVLADEPTGNLDSATGAGVIELLLELNTTYGVTLIIATHDPAIATRCGRTISMVDGRVVAVGIR
jgi:putative ABC transport system ATP-binding protein